MAVLDAELEPKVRRMLTGMRKPVTLVHFTQEQACSTCREQRALLEQLAALSDLITLQIYELSRDAGMAKTYRIDMVPATIVRSERDMGIRFFGVTAGYEFMSLVEAILMVSTEESGLSPEVQSVLKRIKGPVHIEVMVTLSCPYCPRVVRFVHQCAFANVHVQADMIDAAEFPQLTQRYQVSGVPQVIVNERTAFVGAIEPMAAILEILKAVDPDGYEEVSGSLREARGERKVNGARSDHIYDVLVVGAGPAALTAAIYAVRKGLEVAVIGDHPGGQITDTAIIENWPGIAEISGQDLATAFLRHFERNRAAERLHMRVKRLTKAGDIFDAQMTDGTRLQAKTAIFCAGKTYRRLGVPGENRFLGRGIAFCATCDAPLYRDKIVAVVGGGNSAFTAARDLLPFARAIHIVHALEQFQADPVLVDAMRKEKHVTFHMASEVLEFLGSDRLTSIRVRPKTGEDIYDLPIDGVFLEIGLVPNAEPLVPLVGLNEAGEIPVARDQSTAIAGLFAAGDVTDTPDKQIIVAAGQGAVAALAAYRHLRQREGSPLAGRDNTESVARDLETTHG